MIVEHMIVPEANKILKAINEIENVYRATNCLDVFEWRLIESMKKDVLYFIKRFS